MKRRPAGTAAPVACYFGGERSHGRPQPRLLPNGASALVGTPEREKMRSKRLPSMGSFRICICRIGSPPLCLQNFSQNRVIGPTSLFGYNTITWPDSYLGSAVQDRLQVFRFARCDARPIRFQSDPIDGERFERFFLAFRMIKRKLGRQSAAIVLFFSLLDEQQRRLYAALESFKLGYGGDRKMADILGLDVSTVARGRRELLDHDVKVDRVRRAGAGRKLIEKKRQKSSRGSKNS